MVRSIRSYSPISAQKNTTGQPPAASQMSITSILAEMPAQVYIQPRFSMSSLAALHSSSFAQGFGNAEQQSAARALLRHDAHIDGSHYHTRKPSGLHPSNVAFNSYTSADEQSVTQEEFMNEALQDVFDAITMQDRLDGGISILMHCAGSEAPETLSPEYFTIDLYITPREYREMPEHLGGDLSALVQAFSEEFVVPHLQCFAECCRIEGIIPPRHYPAGQVNPSGPTFLPAPLVATGARIQCSAHPTRQFKHDFEVGNKVLLAAVQIGQALAKSNSKPEIRQRHNVDAFLLKRVAEPRIATSTEALSTNGTSEAGGINLTGTTASFGVPLISIGPHTDAVLDRFGLDDQVLPKLHQLIGSIRSSRWEAVLRSPKWNLTYEQASNLSRSLHSDLCGGIQFALVDAKWLSSFLSQMFTFLGTLALVNAYPVSLRNADSHTWSGCTCSSPPDQALSDAWDGLDEMVKTIASSHHKSFRCVQNDLCLGRGLMRFKHSKLNVWNTFCWKKRQENDGNGATGKNVLQELAELLVEYGKHKEMQATGIQISTKAKLNNLRSWTGVESMFYATCGSTNLPVHGVNFTTEGVDEFMSSTMNINSQDLISKMEGFAVRQKIIKSSVLQFSSAIRHEIGKRLVEITKDEDAKMHWTNYFRNVVQCYQVIIEGWPTNIPFTNLSKVSSALPDLDMLLRKWRSNAIKWRRVDDEEFQQLLKERNESLENGEERSGHGLQTHMESRTCRKKTYKSVETVDTDDEDEEPTEETSANNIDTDDASANMNINTDDTGADTDTNINGNTDANLGAFDNMNNGALNFDPATYNLNFLPPSPAAANRTTLAANELMDPDVMLANLDRMFGPPPAPHQL
ncbi:hypothetical protein DFJ58DRAFT_735336 [Suillus subalutaceus]|uniref:uncharacterized protein n=1 Tax=Suillus subalutaceus TaxID=48586 RepID=UPI001B8648F8|nr:uncharacterized protein DFJ58DRAFT_735336 [Suillus subalutaceus]KAG1835967.1 hypothetical protein DFJ58DRAFT_735336 [Suillus subalutaceus]